MYASSSKLRTWNSRGRASDCASQVLSKVHREADFQHPIPAKASLLRKNVSFPRGLKVCVASPQIRKQELCCKIEDSHPAEGGIEDFSSIRFWQALEGLKLRKSCARRRIARLRRKIETLISIRSLLEILQGVAYQLKAALA